MLETNKTGELGDGRQDKKEMLARERLTFEIKKHRQNPALTTRPS